MATRTRNQIRRQDNENRENGRYAKVNPCMLCDKSAGQDYSSDRRTDTTDSAGNSWGDIALVLCAKCARKLDAMPDDEAYVLLAEEPDDARYNVKVYFAKQNEWVLENREPLMRDAANALVEDLTKRGWQVSKRMVNG